MEGKASVRHWVTPPVDELIPLMWAAHNIQYLTKLLQRELFRRIETETFHASQDHDLVELDNMSIQLNHTFFHARGLDVRYNQHSVNCCLAIFPESMSLPMVNLLKIATKMERISKVG